MVPATLYQVSKYRVPPAETCIRIGIGISLFEISTKQNGEVNSYHMIPGV